MSQESLVHKVVAAPLCSGVATSIVFALSSILAGRELSSVLSIAPLFFVIGAVMGGICGVPLVLLLEWKASSWRLRYFFMGPVCALCGWLLFEGAFAGGAWQKVWSSSSFWLEWAPRRVLVFSLIGLLAALLFTASISLVTHFRTRGSR